MKMWDSDHDGYENKIDSMHMGGWGAAVRNWNTVYVCVHVCVCLCVCECGLY